MGSPILWGPNNTSSNLQNQILMANGALLSSNGPKNYITYGNFENNATTGWSLSHSTLSGNLPNQASGSWTSASGNLSIATVSSGQLAGIYSLSLVSSAATTAGDMLVSQVYTIDIEDQAKVLGFKFYYSAASGASNANWSGTSSNSFAVAIYDVTNSAWIQPAGTWNLAQSSGVGVCQGTFQTPSNMTQFRLALFNLNATSGAASVYLDDFFCGPQGVTYTSPMSDWTAFTPTGSWISNVSYTGYWRRIGDSIEVEAQVLCSGAPTSANLTINLPSGLSIDTSKFSNSTSTVEVLGYGRARDAGIQTYPVHVLYNSSTSVVVYGFASLGTAPVNDGSPVTQASPFTFGASDHVTVTFRAPILGWSSSAAVSQSDSSEGRVATATYQYGTFSVPTTSVTVITDSGAAMTKITDTHSAYNTTTGGYTIPVAGNWRITASLFWNNLSSGNTVQVSVKKNSTTGFAVLNSNTTAGLNAGTSGSVVLPLLAGDVIYIEGYQTNASSRSLIGGAYSYFSIERLAGNQSIMASESVNASYTSTSTSTVSTAAPVDYAVRVYDSHNAVTTGASWKFTAPISGKFRVTYSFYVVGTNVPRLYKNGTFLYQGITGTSATLSQGMASVSMLAGDYIDVRADASYTLSNTATNSFICIERVGN